MHIKFLLIIKLTSETKLNSFRHQLKKYYFYFGHWGMNFSLLFAAQLDLIIGHENWGWRAWMLWHGLDSSKYLDFTTPEGNQNKNQNQKVDKGELLSLYNIGRQPLTLISVSD